MPLTDEETGLDKPMPTWVVCLIIGFFLALMVGAGFFAELIVVPGLKNQ